MSNSSGKEIKRESLPDAGDVDVPVPAVGVLAPLTEDPPGIVKYLRITHSRNERKPSSKRLSHRVFIKDLKLLPTRISCGRELNTTSFLKMRASAAEVN